MLVGMSGSRCCCGLVVIVHAFYYNNPSFNATEVYINFLGNCLKINKKRVMTDLFCLFNVKCQFLITFSNLGTERPQAIMSITNIVLERTMFSQELML